MFPIEPAVFFKLEFSLGISLVFLGRVVSPLALTALERDELHVF